MPAQSFAELGLAPARRRRCTKRSPARPGSSYLTGPTGSGKTTTLHAALHTFDHPGASSTRSRTRWSMSSPASGRPRSAKRSGSPLLPRCARCSGRTRTSCSWARRATRRRPSSRCARRSPGTSCFRRCTPTMRWRRFRACATSASKPSCWRRRCALSRPSGSCGNCARVQGAASRQRAAARAEHHLPGAHFFRPVGCAACRGRGYRGRLAIHEVIPAQKFLPLIAAHAPLAELAALREREGCLHLLAARARGGRRRADDRGGGRARALNFNPGRNP
jgi:hypothetical protein